MVEQEVFVRLARHPHTKTMFFILHIFAITLTEE
jgi:hypothetical protein